MAKSLSALLKKIDLHPQISVQAKEKIEHEAQSINITGVNCHTGKLQTGNAFFCVVGEKMDGNKFAPQAAEKGAACIFTERLDLELDGRINLAPTIIPVIPVADVRLAMACAANYFFDYPSQQLRILGITGTNGKTTTSHLVEYILNKSGQRCGIIGTLGARWPKSNGEIHIEVFGQTTPQAPEFQNMLRQMVENKVTYVVMEVSSHALALNHAAGTQFASACLTNITQDHLDFHKSMENYWQSKRRLFEAMVSSTKENKSAIVNANEPLAAQFLSVLTPDIKKYTYNYNTKSGATLNLLSAQYDFDHSKLRLLGPEGEFSLNLKIGGPFNVENAMAAFLICYAEGISQKIIIEALEEFTGVPGRFEIIRSSPSAVEAAVGAPAAAGRHLSDAERVAAETKTQVSAPAFNNDNPLVIVDYAHTPDGLENVLKAARALVPSGGKLMAVFGCGGDRDASKRPRMGEIAQRLADKVIVTSDNPRSENPQKIIADILTGISQRSSVDVEPDRAEAIKNAISKSSASDVIVIAGKGHEDYQILGDRTIKFDDRQHARQYLLARNHK